MIDTDEEDENELPFDRGAGALDDFLGKTRIPFQRDDLKNAESLRTSEFKPVVLAVIANTTFTMRYKQALARWAHAFLSKDMLLSDSSLRKMGRFSQKNIYEVKQITAQLELAKTRLARSKTDRLNVACDGLEADFMYVHECLLSRTIGPKRERLINLEHRVVNENIERSGGYETVNAPEGQKEKRGLLGFGR